MLNQLSFDAGEADGYMGPLTAKAIRRFQKTHGLKPDGQMSEDVMRTLYRAAGKGVPTNGRVYVRQDFKPLFTAPVKIHGGDEPLGSHLLTAMQFTAAGTRTRWRAVTLTRGSDINRLSRLRLSSIDAWEIPIAIDFAGTFAGRGSSAHEALSRIEIPDDIRQRINELLTPGSSVAITNDGISQETTPDGTDFIVLMQ